MPKAHTSDEDEPQTASSSTLVPLATADQTRGTSGPVESPHPEIIRGVRTAEIAATRWRAFTLFPAAGDTINAEVIDNCQPFSVDARSKYRFSCR
jgi:hypothetical protein